MSKYLKTYSHLAGARRIPSDYEIGATRMLYYPSRGFEVRTPIASWYDRHQRGSALQCSDWEGFNDPRATTYASYVKSKRSGEDLVDGVLRSIQTKAYDQGLDPSWLAVLESILPVARYPVHGLQMAAAYVGHMAPSGKVVMTALFQAGDEMRRVHRLAYRMCQLGTTRPGFGDASKDTWQRHPAWQPLRELIERLLVTYDWGEAFVALNLGVKPAFDAWLMRHLPEKARSAGDPLLGELFYSLAEDCAWHAEWSNALAEHAIKDTPGNRNIIETWAKAWSQRATQAIAPLSALLPLA